MITVTRVTIYDSISRRMSFNVNNTFESQQEAKRHFRFKFTNEGYEVIRVLIDYDEEE
jgi:hypothetical protein